MIDENLSKEKELLLLKACKDNNGVVSKRLAERIYSSKSSAKSAIERLEIYDFIEYTSPGHWKVVKLPNNIKRDLKHLMSDEEDNQKEQKAPEERESSSEFKIKA